MWNDEQFINGLMHGVIGREIRGVEYLYPGGIQGIAVDHGGRVHEVDHGVRLLMSDGDVVTLMWQLDGICAALGVVAGSGHDAGLTELVESYDVSTIPMWATLLGRPVTDVGVAWHSSDFGCPATPWAFRFGVGGRRRFVVALAEVRDGRLSYIPDNIVVIFDDDLAHSYRCVGSATSSWGVDLFD